MMRSSLLLLILICVTGACRTSSNPETTSTQLTSTVATPPTPITTPSPTAQPVDDFIVTAEITKGDVDNSDDYQLRIEYPQLKRPTTQNEKRFNQHVKTLVEKEIREFEAFCRKEKRRRKKPPGYHLGLSYSSTFVSKKLLCLNLRWESYTGYVNSDWFTTTINYDLEKGRELRFVDLFNPKSDYLSVISQIGLKVLKKTCLGCGCEGGLSAGDTLPDGVENSDRHSTGVKSLKEAVAPELENFNLWNLTDKGIAITFDEYEIAPGCAGLISILLPFEGLKSVLRKEILTNQL